MAVETARPRPRAKLRSSRRAWIALVVIAGGLGFLFVNLGKNAVLFKTADEAVAQRAKIGTHPFRIEGTVVAGSISQHGTSGADFTIESKGVRVAVVHTGNQPELFQSDIPVVLEGRWRGTVFASDRILVKHSESYRKANPDRVKDYQGK